MNSDLIIEFNNAEFAVNLLTLILATSVGAQINGIVSHLLQQNLFV